MTCYRIAVSDRFRKDLRISFKRGCDIQRLKEAVRLLAAGEELPPRCRVRRLPGNSREFFKCHIEADWLVVYRIDEERRILFLARHGTHEDIFR